MLAESHALVRRFLRFLALPYCYFKLVNWSECPRTRWQVLVDLLYIYFVLKYFPDNYSPCRLWEKSREDWAYYYGSTYHSYARRSLRREVQTFEHQILFNDKSVTEILCKGIGVPIPQGFGVVSPAENLDHKLRDIFGDSSQKLIVKPVLGHAGQGIVLAEKKGDAILITDGSSEHLAKDYKITEKCFVQRVVVQDSKIAKFNSSSLNTIRVVTLLTKSNEVLVLSASMRFGVAGAFVDNWSAGGVAVGVDKITGKLMPTAYDKKGNCFSKHPQSNICFDGYIVPFWKEVLDIARTVQEHCYFYRLIGTDIALSDEGPTLVEVNANPDIVFQEQTAGPLLRDCRTLREFANYGLLTNKRQLELLNL